MNLFIVSNLGQLFQAQNVIKQNNLKDNVIAILWTSRNTIARDNIANNVDEKLFKKVELHKLPNFPNKLHVNNLLKIRKGYMDLVEKYSIDEIFVCNYNSHYNFLYDIAQLKGIKINMFEEGLGTYKSKIVLDRNQKIENPSFIQRLKKATKVTFRDVSNSIRETDIYRWIVVIIGFIAKNILKPIYTLFKGFARIFLSILPKKQMDKLLTLKLPKEIRSFVGTIPKFDKAYFTFPDRGKEIFKADEYKELKLEYELKSEVRRAFKESVTLQLIDRRSVIFLDQVYNVPADMHTDLIINYLHEKFPDRNVFIKMHPRSKKEIRKEFERKVAEYKHIRLLSLDIEMPFEAILLEKKPKIIVSLTSTSLVYGPKLVKGTRSISCVNSYLNNLNRSIVKDQVLEEIEIDRDTIISMGGVELD